MSDRIEDRRDFYTVGPGIAYITDVSDRWHEGHQAAVPVEHISATALDPIALDTSTAALAIVATELCARTAPYAHNPDYATLGVTEEDRDPDKNPSRFFSGLGDMDFGLQFAPVLAAQVVDGFVANGLMTVEQRDNMALSDWAAIIRTQWFSELAHSLGFAKSGSFGQYGTQLQHYLPGQLAKLLVPADHNGALLQHTRTASQGWEQNTAELEPGFKRDVMHANLRGSRGPGCPGARHSGTFPAELIDTNPHIKALLASGRMVINSYFERPGEPRVALFAIRHTAIQQSLEYVADYLERYDAQFGTPYLNRQNGQLEHRHKA